MNINALTTAEPLKMFPTHLPEKVTPFVVSQKKALEYAGLFTLLTAIYYCSFGSVAKTDISSLGAQMTFFQVSSMTLKAFLFTGWPFVLLAYFDRAWRSRDAGTVLVASYIATNILLYHKTGYDFCLFATSLQIIPYIFVAWAAHGLGALRFRLRF
jgi:hypothetical protein